MTAATAPVVIYHNPRCSNSRGALALIREAGIEPEVIDYLSTPPDRATLQALVAATGGSVRALMREKEALFAELGLDQPGVTDAQWVDAVLAHPVLLNRPIVVTALGTALCRPPERVLALLPR
ncbi:arsenate reductase (glutaredoxin) [Ideonella livida]|uniref:Arsenate reductase n=1 Tax=Ideonella livida TaxID=2707176 RepID=A0A7C9PGG6_9BURK|nr:arsenate reductase (glutaredoxin) [Ideonella livida]NDY91337.1 arsenate reductase (glutaredoxin) [Ideonella livida]